jgi:hypothetical protein
VQLAKFYTRSTLAKKAGVTLRQLSDIENRMKKPLQSRRDGKSGSKRVFTEAALQAVRSRRKNNPRPLLGST